MVRLTARSEWGRRYPPLALLAAAISLAALALPSTLILPQANPAQTLEYAPVPGSSNTANGNTGSLGLGSSSTLGFDRLGGLLGGLPNGSGNAPSGKACVGNPPRQTEDPLSPPCVAYFSGDNGGSVYTGVTRNEITVLFRMDTSGNTYVGDSNGPEQHGPPTGYYDMDNPNDVSQFFEFVHLHQWEVYFNTRYQTYNRHVHFWVSNFAIPSTDTSYTYTPAQSSAEAEDNWSVKHPFAVLQNPMFDTDGDYPITYADAMARHGVLSFGSYEYTQSQASRYPGLFWSYPPSLDSQAAEYADFVCRRVVGPGRVTFSNNNDHGQQRVYALLLTNDQTAQVTQERQQLTVQYLKQDCNPPIVDTEYFAYSGSEASGPQSGWGTANVARMRSKGVTTVLWPGGGEYDDMNAASTARWYPEWLIEGDNYMDGLSAGDGERPDEMAHAWVTTPAPLIDDPQLVERPCLDAITSVDPQINRSTNDIYYACQPYYDDLRQLFTGIQLAGPHLTPASMNSGFHAIPRRPSTSPYTPSCYYLPGDYTCVKDATAEWWDPNAVTTVGSQPGCYRMWQNGRRYLTGGWPREDVTVGVEPNDVCNLYSPPTGYSLRAS